MKNDFSYIILNILVCFAQNTFNRKLLITVSLRLDNSQSVVAQLKMHQSSSSSSSSSSLGITFQQVLI